VRRGKNKYGYFNWERQEKISWGSEVSVVSLCEVLSLKKLAYMAWDADN
jgi:hypothetical protein